VQTAGSARRARSTGEDRPTIGENLIRPTLLRLDGLVQALSQQLAGRGEFGVEDGRPGGCLPTLRACAEPRDQGRCGPQGAATRPGADGATIGSTISTGGMAFPELNFEIVHGEWRSSKKRPGRSPAFQRLRQSRNHMRLAATRPGAFPPCDGVADRSRRSRAMERILWGTARWPFIRSPCSRPSSMIQHTRLAHPGAGLPQIDDATKRKILFETTRA